MTTWFTSDTHFGHKRIIELAKRPFASLEEMDNIIINNWNKRVLPGDQVYHLGDFAFDEHDPYLERLNGQKFLCLGNHDHSKRWKKATKWVDIDNYREIKVGDQLIILFHYAMRVWNKSGHGSIHLYGHSHNNLPGDAQSCDVGVDSWGMCPVTLDDIKKRLAIFPSRKEPDHHGKK